MFNALGVRARKEKKKKKVREERIVSLRERTPLRVPAVVANGCKRLFVLLFVPLGVVIEVGVYTQTITVLIFITTKLTRETFKRTVYITDMEFEILFTREVTQAPRTRVHADYLATFHTQRRTEFGDDA